jgi:hypothetical protein
MALDDKWMDVIFTKLMLTYGTRFAAQYGPLSLEEIRADWAHALTGISADGIKHALMSLPRDFPPNVLQFKYLCHTRPERQSGNLLPPPKPGQMAPAVRERLLNLMALINHPKDPKAWAKRLREREAMGEDMPEWKRSMWREALADNKIDDEQQETAR